ncbi:hypothetical protein [Streptomyces coerulescens]|uniref:Lipoprotein n=1 Tax=Streptomyces coerulescens TaxID=29304 RepID=A0ABW0CLG1_STRCD
MRTTPTRARRLVTAVAGAALVTGCGGAAHPSPAEVSRTTASPAPFNQQNTCGRSWKRPPRPPERPRG